MLTEDRETYVRELLDGLDAWPTCYAHMADGNAGKVGLRLVGREAA